MKKIQLLLFSLIMFSIAAKVSVAPIENEKVVLTTGENPEVEKFFRYRVNNIQFQENIKITRCPVRSSCCEA